MNTSGNNKTIKRPKDWSFPLSEDMCNMIDRLVDLIEQSGGQPPEIGTAMRREFWGLLRDIQVEARSSLWTNESRQAAIIRYYSMGEMFK